MPPTKKELHSAYEAGRALRRTNDDTLPKEAVEDPVGACPFSEGDPQRAEWLQGYKDAVDEENSQRPGIIKGIEDALKLEDASSTVKS